MLYVAFVARHGCSKYRRGKRSQRGFKVGADSAREADGGDLLQNREGFGVCHDKSVFVTADG